MTLFLSLLPCATSSTVALLYLWLSLTVSFVVVVVVVCSLVCACVNLTYRTTDIITYECARKE